MSAHRFPVTSGLLLTLLVVGALAACQVSAEGQSYKGTELPDRPFAPDFHLVDQAGRAAALSDSRGEPVVLTFLDSRCVDVCPLTAVMLRETAKALGASSGQVAFLGVNTNSFAAEVEDVRLWTEENRLGEIAGWRFLTGSPRELEAVWQAYFIAVEATTARDVTHGAGIYLIDRQGRERWYFGVDPDASAVASMSRTLTQRIQALLREG
jgi:protein SCO1/2